MKTYVLVNPVISGNVDTAFEASNALDAANQAYGALSKYFSNSVKNFKFTLVRSKSSDVDLSKVSGGNLLHFKVSEEKNSNSDKVEYVIKPLKTDVTNVDTFKARAARAMARVSKMEGGKSKYAEEDDSDSDSEDYVPKRRYYTEPIRYFYYYPFLYPGDEKYYLPLFPFNVEYIVDAFGMIWPSVNTTSNTVTVTKKI